MLDLSLDNSHKDNSWAPSSFFSSDITEKSTGVVVDG